MVSSEFDPVVAIVLLGEIYLVLRFATWPLSRLIARLNFSIRWKFEFGIAVIAVMFLIVSLIQIGAMNFMHDELHGVQDLMRETRDIRQVAPAIRDLEQTHHGSFYRLLPFLGVLGAAAVGAAMAWSVIEPVRRMGQGMDRIASGDFSKPVTVENLDELGDLAGRLNDTARDLARLQEATWPRSGPAHSESE